MTAYQKEIKGQWQGSVNTLDLMGTFFSLFCLAHCMLLPLLPLFLTAVPWLGDESTHWILLLLIVPVAVLALYHGYRRHHRRSVLLYGTVGLVLLLLAIALEDHEKALTVAGSLALCTAHFKNRQCCTPSCCAPR